MEATLKSRPASARLAEWNASVRPNWPLFTLLATIAGAVLLWAGRQTSYSPDELAWFIHSPGLDLNGALQPHAGHLILTTRLVYGLIFDVVGVDYVSFRILTALTVIAAGALFYAYTSRRIGSLAALAPTAILLVFGSDATHMVLGNGFTVVGSVACGIGALLALDRDDRRGEVIACALLVLGVLTYTTALAFVLGIAVSLLIRPDRWQRLWIVAIPIVVYATWWIWSLDQSVNSGSQIVVSDVLVFPAWAFQSLAAVASAVTGLDYEFAPTATNAAGTVLAFVVIGVIGWRIRRRGVTPALWAVIATALALWLMGSVSQTDLRQPDSSRYLYPGAAIVTLALAGAAATLPRSRGAVVAIFAVAAVGVATNLALLRDSTDLFRGVAAISRAEIGGLALAGGQADPAFVPTGGSPTVALAFASVGLDGLQPTGSLLTATGRYGIPGDDVDELRAADETSKARADADHDRRARDRADAERREGLRARLRAARPWRQRRRGAR